MDFEWDDAKAKRNLKKHKVSFDEAATVFYDALSATGPDPDHSILESRWVTFGRSVLGRLLAVAHTDRDDAIRIISARVATAAERAIYEKTV
jgi:uncharacterized DUF497 family protein